MCATSGDLPASGQEPLLVTYPVGEVTVGGEFGLVLDEHPGKGVDPDEADLTSGYRGEELEAERDQTGRGHLGARRRP